LSLQTVGVNPMGGPSSSGSGSFPIILTVTLIQGLLLHIALWIFIGLVSLFVRSTPPGQDYPIGHGFQVVMPPAPAPRAVAPIE
jgi:hypothetical protein